jgi:hypothetical protein
MRHHHHPNSKDRKNQVLEPSSNNVYQEVISCHEGKCNDEPNNGLWSDKLFLFVSRKIVHISLNSHKKIYDWFSLSNRLTPNGCKPIEEP